MKRHLMPAFVIGMIVLICIALSKCGCDKPDRHSHAEPFEGGPETQAKREAFIRRAIETGIFAKIDDARVCPHVWVTPMFSILTFEEKQKLLSIVLAYYYEAPGPDAIIILRDNMTGKEVGRMSGAGLKLD